MVVKFRRGLNPAIADAVATMAAGRPDDLDPEAWYEAAVRIDQNQATNAAFRSAHASVRATVGSGAEVSRKYEIYGSCN